MKNAWYMNVTRGIKNLLLNQKCCKQILEEVFLQNVYAIKDVQKLFWGMRVYKSVLSELKVSSDSFYSKKWLNISHRYICVWTVLCYDLLIHSNSGPECRQCDTKGIDEGKINLWLITLEK